MSDKGGKVKSKATEDEAAPDEDTTPAPESPAAEPSDAAASPSSNGSADAVPAGTAAGTSADPSTQVVDKAALLAASAFAVTDVPLPSGRGIVRVRPLSRAEAMAAYGKEMNAAQMECWVLSKACVEPSFSEKEVGIWQENSAAGADVKTVLDTVLHISGMDIGAGKDAYKRFRGAT